MLLFFIKKLVISKTISNFACYYKNTNKLYFMKLRKIFNAAIIAFLAVVCFVSCESVEGGSDNNNENIKKSILYGNCTDPVNNKEDGRFGMNQSYTMATVTKLNGEELFARGTEIAGIRALIDGEVTNAEVFVLSDRNLDSVLAKKSFTWKDEGWQYVLFDEPVAITGDDLYMVYKITSTGYVIGLESTKTKKDTEYMWWENEWYQLSEMGVNGCWSIQAILTGGDYSQETQYAISIDELSIPEATRANDNFKATLEVRNTGVCSINGLEIVSNVAGKETSITIERVLNNGETAKFDVVASVGNVEGNVDFSVKVKIKGQNVESEEYKKSLKVYAGLKRNAILIEQFTGQDCSNCPAGANAIKKAISELTDPEQVCWVAHHTYMVGVGDAFTIPGTLDVSYALGVNAAPQCNINRCVMKYNETAKETLIWHPGYVTSSLLASLIPTPADATLELTREFNADTRELKVAVKGKSLKDVAYVTVLVNQDKMLARQSGAAGDYYHTSPRAFLTSSLGDKLTLDKDGNYSVEYTYTIPAKVGSFDCVIDNMEVVAFVHGDINDANAREIYNADKIKIQ